MLKRTVALGIAVAVISMLASSLARAEEPKAAAKPTVTVKAAGATQGTPPKMAVHKGPAANMVAVCGCGKVFVPEEKTLYVESNGRRYACCSPGCHEMALADPAKAAKMAEENTAKLLAPPKTDTPK